MIVAAPFIIFHHYNTLCQKSSVIFLNPRHAAIVHTKAFPNGADSSPLFHVFPAKHILSKKENHLPLVIFGRQAVLIVGIDFPILLSNLEEFQKHCKCVVISYSLAFGILPKRQKANQVPTVVLYHGLRRVTVNEKRPIKLSGI